jgi:hypothetical protein
LERVAGCSPQPLDERRQRRHPRRQHLNLYPLQPDAVTFLAGDDDGVVERDFADARTVDLEGIRLAARADLENLSEHPITDKSVHPAADRTFGAEAGHVRRVESLRHLEPAAKTPGGHDEIL